MIFKNTVAFSFLILFLYTATSKLLDNGQFVYQLKISPLPLVSVWAEVLSYIVPLIEILIVIYLAVGVLSTRYMDKAIGASIFLISIFEIYIIGMLVSGLNLPCSCGGIIALLSWKAHLIFNGLFIIAGLVALKARNPVFKKDWVTT